MATLRGHAIVFDVLSEDLGFRERVLRQAVERALARRPDVLALVDHDPGRIIGRMAAGTLSLTLDERGLVAEIDPPDTTPGRDAVISVKRGDTRGMSFAFRMLDEVWLADVGDEMIREITDMELIDVTVTAVPAYPQTSVTVIEGGMRRRSVPAGVPNSVNAARLRLMASG